MCGPMAMAGLSFVVGAAKAVSGFMGQQAAADAQNERHRQNAEAAREAQRQDFRLTNTRRQQEEEAATLRKAKVDRQAREAQATAENQAGESNVTGFSVDHLLNEFGARAGQFSSRTDRQTEMTLTQLEAQDQKINARAQSRINSVPRAPSPSFFDAGIRIAGSALSAGGQFMQNS